MYEYQSGEFVCGYWGLKGQLVLIQLCTQTNKPCFEIVNLQSFTHFINSPCSRVERNYRCIKSEKARILFSNMHKSYNNKLYYGISIIIFQKIGSVMMLITCSTDNLLQVNFIGPSKQSSFSWMHSDDFVHNYFVSNQTVTFTNNIIIDLGVFVITFLHNFQNFVQSTLSLWTPRYNGCSDDVESS